MAKSNQKNKGKLQSVGRVSTPKTPAPNPAAVSLAGYWPDGTLKLKRPDGTILPHGTTVTVGGSGSVIKDAAGNVIQIQTDSGAALNPIQGLNDLPAGSYDPALGYQAGAANRGLGYQQQDYDNTFRGWQIGPDGQLVRPGDLSSAGRAVQDYFTNYDRLNQQYDWQRDDTHRGYQELGNNQLQGINQRGLLGGGALAQALAKRTVNEGRDQERISTTRTQSLADLLTQSTRGATDAYTGLQRAVGENAPYQATLFQQAAQQAQPYLADDPNYEVHNGVLYQRTPSGQIQAVSSPPKPPKAPSQNNGPGGARYEPRGQLVAVNPKKKRRPNTGGAGYP